MVLAVLSADRRSLNSAIAYMPPPSLVDSEATDAPPVLPIFPDGHDIALDVEGKWYWLDIPPFGQIDIR